MNKNNAGACAKWYFSFCQKHVSPNGKSLKNVVVEIEGNFGDARAKMFELVGENWGFQYGSMEDAGVSMFDLEVVTPEEFEEKFLMSKAEPDYEVSCEICGQVPTVVIDGNNLGMCGVCTWGEADCADPSNW